jgi:septum site-determining protein MinC
MTDAIPNSHVSNLEAPNLLNQDSNSTGANVEVPNSNQDSNSTVANVEVPNSNQDSNSTVANVEANITVLDIDSTELLLKENTVNKNAQVQFKSDEGKLLLILPTESQVSATEGSWYEIWQQMKIRLKAGDRLFVPSTHVQLVAGDRLLDTRQLQELDEALSEAQMQLKSVSTSRRQTAIAAVSGGYSVEQQEPQSLLSTPKTASTPLEDALYLEMTVRSGAEIRHGGTVIILGDLNPGGIVVADGDILVWGRLRGVAHAGANGNRDCLIMALQMEPTQLRIADAVARSPEKSLTQFYPEMAYVTSEGIRITKATDFSKIQINRMKD